MATRLTPEDFAAILTGARNGEAVVETPSVTVEPEYTATDFVAETPLETVESLDDATDYDSTPLATQGRHISTESRSHDIDWKKFGTIGAVGTLALVAVAGGVSLGNRQTTPSKPPTIQNGLGVLPTKAPSASPNGQSSLPPAEANPEAQDYNLGYIGFGTQKKGCRELGAYSIAATTTIANLGGLNYLVTIPETNVDMLSCENKVIGTVENIPTEEPADFVKKRVTTDQAKITGYASFAKGTKAPTVKPLSELQTGYVDRGYKAATVCRSLPLLDGCKNAASWALTNAKKSKIIASAQVLILKGVQKVCGPVEIDTEKKAIAAAYAAQAAQLGVDPSYIELVYKNPTKVPNYIGALVKKLAAKGAVISNAGLSKLFPKPAITPVCKSDTIVASQG